MPNVDDPYTLDQLKDPQMNALIVRPLVDRLYDPEDICIGEYYCASFKIIPIKDPNF